MTTASVAATKPEVPPQANNSYRFSLFNAVNFQITLDAPNVVRGVSTGTWLPWLTALVPENARGSFLGYDQVHRKS